MTYIYIQLDVDLHLWLALGILLKLDLPHKYFYQNFVLQNARGAADMSALCS